MSNSKQAGLVKYLPKVLGDRVAFTFLLIMIHLLGFFELLVVLPVIYKHHSSSLEYWWHVTVGWFIYFQVMCSLWKTITVNTTSGSIILPSYLKPGWKFCAVCEHNTPPRSFHCYVCNNCILKRDHHCLFTGNCIGHANSRHFLTLLMYLAIAAFYCNYLNIDYTWDVLGGLSWKTLISMVIPLVSWALGITETFTFGVAFISASSLFGFLFLSGFLFYHLSNVYFGQSTYERSHNIKDYDLGWKENLRQVYGIKWKYAWISSLVPSQLPSNGVEFFKKDTFENVKDM